MEYRGIIISKSVSNKPSLSSRAVASKQAGSDSVVSVSNNSVVITKQQILILAYIYWFRFVSTKQLQFLLGKKQIQQVQQRLNLLLGRGWIGRNFSTLDRLTGRYASYYLLPGGTKALKRYKFKLGFELELDPKVLHAIYKDKTASSRFINRCLGVGDINCSLRQLHGNELEFFSKTEIASDNYLPELRPDAYLRLTNSSKVKPSETEYLLEYCEETTPFWVHRKRLKQYIEYNDEGLWQDQTARAFPTILLVAENTVLQRRLQRFIKRITAEIWADDLRFYVSNKELLATAKPNEAIWTEYEEDEEVMRLRTLEQV